MTTFLYTNTCTLDSSFLKRAYYDKTTERLVVVINDGNYVGYEGIHIDTYDEFIRADSAGQYWNWYIKGHPERFSTADIDSFRKREDESLVPAAGVDHGSKPEVSEAPAMTQTYIVNVETSTFDSDLYVEAVDISEAIAKANEIAKIAGWKNHTIYSVTLNA